MTGRLDSADPASPVTVAVRDTRQASDRAVERLEAVSRITGAVIRSASLDEVLQRIVTGVRDALSTTTATLLLKEAGILRVRASSGVHPADAAAVRVPVGEGFAGTIAATRASRVIPDVGAHDVVSEYLRDAVASLAGVPLIADGELVGVLHVGSGSPDAFADDDRLFLELVAVPAAAAIVRARLYEGERRARQAAEAAARRTARLQEVTAALSTALPRREVIEAMVGPALRALGAAAGAVIETDGNGFALLDAVGYPADTIRTWSRFSDRPETPVAEVGRTLEPVFIGSRLEWLERYSEVLPDSEVDAAWAALPLRIGARLLGVLVARLPAPQQFSEQDRSYALAVAHQCAQALERGRLHDVERAARERAEIAAQRANALEHASALLASSLDYERTVGHVSELVVPDFCDFCQVYLRDIDHIKRVGSACVDPAKRLVLERLKDRPPLLVDGDTPLGEVVRTGETQLISVADDGFFAHVADDADHLSLLASLGPRTLIVAPLRARASVIGAIAMGRFDGGHPYTEEDRAFARELGRRAGMAVENARLYRELEEASEAKSQFLSTMSHELRTPLNAIIGYASLLRDGVAGQLSEPQREHISRILTASDHLLLLINEVLTLARVEAGKEHVDTVQCDLAQLVNDVASLISPIVRERGLTLEIDSPQSVPCTTDGTKLRQILLNLLSNACKFAERGTVALSLEERQGEAVFSVRDTGRGIATDDLERIFEPFYQVSQGTTRTEGGTGLGLTVSRRLARLLGGDLRVESTLGTGSTFTLTVPLTEPRR